MKRFVPQAAVEIEVLISAMKGLRVDLEFLPEYNKLKSGRQNHLLIIIACFVLCGVLNFGSLIKKISITQS